VDVTINEKLDLIHVHYAIPHASAAYLAKQILKYKGIHVPVITTLHGTDITLVGRDPSFEPVVTFSINESDGVTAVSESLKNDTYNEFEILSHIEVIPNFIDLQRFQKRPHEHFKKSLCPNGEKLLMHTSNFRKVKRIQDIVKVFAIVRKKNTGEISLYW
jgi:N-acetyl-alpha-D-glucosaminyl L-malate synthase BshA